MSRLFRMTSTKWRRCISFVVLFLSLVSTVAQASPLNDSLPFVVLSEKSFLSVLRSYHPVIKQAELQQQRAAAAVTASRGGFDPLLTTTSMRKRFGDELYYEYFNPELVIPTWYGIEIYAGNEKVNGSRVNSETTLGKSSYLGASVPLLKDLVIDKRRAMLHQARIFSRQTAADRDQAVNDLSFDAITAYWNWVKTYQNLWLLDQVLGINEERIRFVKLEILQGNRPAIDSIEALTQLQFFDLLNKEARLQFNNAGLELSVYLWKKDGEPYLLPVTAVPDSMSLADIKSGQLPLLEDLLQTARTTHPKLRAYSFKLDWLAIEQKLKWQGLLPKLDVKAQLLNKGYGVLTGFDKYLLENNYKFGFEFRMPLRLSEARGEYREARYKIAQIGQEQSLTFLMIENKVKSYYNETLTLQSQVSIQARALENFRKLLEGELTRFRIGESSLFLINSREQKLLEAQQKLIELSTKYFKSRAGILWASGQYQ